MSGLVVCSHRKDARGVRRPAAGLVVASKY
jgi:hypothetical protein